MKTNILFYLLSGLFLLASCAKEYSVDTSGKKRVLGNWEFKDSTNEYMGTIDTAYITSAGMTNKMTISGKSLDSKHDFTLNLFADDKFEIGSYLASTMESSFHYTEGGKSIYTTDQADAEFIVKITSVEGDLFTGTFSGKAKDSTGTSKDLFDGKFKFTFANASSPVSNGILGSEAGVCEPVSLNGNYENGVDMNDENTVELDVTVAKPGLYNIFTESVDGISFSGSGMFNETGLQKVKLIASGTPTSAGDKKFIVTYGNSKCEFIVTVTEGGVAADYFPLNTNTEWRYGNGTDSVLFKVIGDKKTVGTQEFSQIKTHAFYPTESGADTLLIRKKSGDYYSFLPDLITQNLENVTLTEVIILKDYVPAGTSWTSTALTANVGGAELKVETKFTIVEKSVPASVGPFDFPDVIKMKEESMANGAPYMTREVWYARNVGVIYQKTDAEPYKIGSYRIF